APTEVSITEARAPASAAQPTRATQAPRPVTMEPVPAGSSSANLTVIYQGTEVPLDQFNATSRILTPSVGRVRVRKSSGDGFEGRLYAVGQGQLVLETPQGKLTLDASTAAAVERLEGVVEASPNGDASSLPGARVRVVTAGGAIVGKLVARDG